MTDLSPIEVSYSFLCEKDVIPKKKKATWKNHLCSVCGKTQETLPAGSLLGQTFGSWQEVSQFNTTSNLCKKCAWAFKDKKLLRSPVLITYQSANYITWTELGLILSERSLNSEESVIAPVGGRKIVAPYATWGMVTADYGNLKWSSQYQKALKACFQLHKVGIRGSLLLEPSIPYKTLQQTDPRKHSAIQEMWEYLRFMREDKTLRMLFAKLSMNIGK